MSASKKKTSGFSQVGHVETAMYQTFKIAFKKQTRKWQFKVSSDSLISFGDNDVGVTGWADLW